MLLGRNLDGYLVVTARYLVVTTGFCSLPGGYCLLLLVLTFSMNDVTDVQLETKLVICVISLQFN